MGGSREIRTESLELGEVEVAVWTGEVPVDLQEGVVVGGLGVGAERFGPFTEELEVVGEVVAFPLGADGGRSGEPRSCVGRGVGSGAERPRERQRPGGVGELGADLLPPAADQLSGCMGEVELFVGTVDWWE